MCVLFARTASGPDPLVARLAAEVVALRQPAAHHPGLHRFFQGATWLWAGIFLLLTAGLVVLMVTEPAGVFLTLRPPRLSARRRRNVRVHPLVPPVLRQARPQAPFRPGLSPPAAAGSP